jgi:hypothetical protein
MSDRQQMQTTDREKTMKTYIQITVCGSSYIPMALDDLTNNAPGRLNEILGLLMDPEMQPLTIDHIEMTEEAFNALPEFDGF